MKQKIQRYLLSLAATILTASLVLIPAVLSKADGVTDNPTAWKKVDGTYRNSKNEPVPGVISRGIDVSKWQGDNVEWNKVASSDVSFVMFGLGRIDIPDPMFERNIKGAIDNNLKIGAYLYSVAKTPEEAAAEARYALDQIKDYPISFPVAYDIEGDTAQLDKQLVTDIIVTFCEIIKEAGYYPMIYANETVLNNKIDFSRAPYDIWVARYNYFTSWPNPSMWQTTSSYYMDGITKNTVDVNFLFKDYSALIAEKGWRHINGSWYFYSNYRKQSGWIQDGGHSYYLNKDGQMQSGWLDYENENYYLWQNGTMAKGWVNDNSNWVFFKSNGMMAKNQWISDGDQYYFLQEDGHIKIGWFKENKMDYYLRSNGSMAVKWEKIDGYWYFFQSSGAMAKGWINDNGGVYHMDSTGVMQTGWFKEGSDTYYLRDNGSAAKGWHQIADKWYHFGNEGKMNTGWAQSNGSWYYLNQDGKMAINTFIKDNNITYRVNESGAMNTGWVKVDSHWYYFNGSGKMITGWLGISDKWYYLYEDGKMASGTTITVNGTAYDIGDDGVWIPKVPEPVTVNESVSESIAGGRIKN